MTDERTDDEAWLDALQRAAFGYFTEAVNPISGLVTDTSRAPTPVSIAVVGFALSVYPVGVERGWLTRADALARCLTTLRFFASSDQSGSETATGYKGFYYHFLDADTGKRVWRSELSMIDTALLIAGAFAASHYFIADTPEERELRDLADAMYRRIDWRWAQDGELTIRQGWKPEAGFLHYAWDGYSEAIILYVLALGSPTFGIDSNCYSAWTATYQWENLYGHELLYAGPMFVHQFSHAWIDLRGTAGPVHARQAVRLFREQPASGLRPARICATQSAGVRRVRPMLLGLSRRVTGQATSWWMLRTSDATASATSRVARRTAGRWNAVMRGAAGDVAVRPGDLDVRRARDARALSGDRRTTDGWRAASIRAFPVLTAVHGCRQVTSVWIRASSS